MIFVPYAACGDELEIEIIERKKKFARGRIVKILKPSTERTDPLCPYYGKCGGCCYQHLNYDEQLRIKKKQVIEAFQKIGKITVPPVWDPIASPLPYNYRGKATLHAAKTREGLALGFLDISGGQMVDIGRCEIMDETINDQIRLLRENIQQPGNNENLTIWSQFPFGATGSGDSVTRMVKGKEFLAARGGFFQANLLLTDHLVDEVCRLVAACKIRTLVDAYCGSGLFSIFLSPFVESIMGIEENEVSIKFARLNAQKYATNNVTFIAGDVAETLQRKLLPGADPIDLMLLDPPRTGCEPAVLQAIVARKPLNIIYISCNPATQARDVQYLNGFGYKLQSLLPVDMFPQTEHIEVIGFIVRTGT